MSIFSRGSEKRKDFVKNTMDNELKDTGEYKIRYTEKEANDEYMEKKKEWAKKIIDGFKTYCKALCDPKKDWDQCKAYSQGRNVFLANLGELTHTINEVMSSTQYKNVTQGGSSSKYLEKTQDHLGMVSVRAHSTGTDPENFKSSMQSCGKGLSKLKHPIGSTALVKLGEKRERVVDCVDELARLMLNKTVQENAAILLRLHKGEDWPDDGNGYTYKAVEPKYVKL